MPALQARLFDLARLKQHLDADSEIPLRELHRRDHALAEKIVGDQDDALTQLVSWLNLRDSTPASAGRYQHMEGLLVFVLTALGFVLGLGAMIGMLFANQQQPVNLLLFLSLFVGLQLLLLLVTVASAFAPLPANQLASPFSFLNPAMWAGKRLLRQFSSAMPWQQVPQLLRMLILRWGQWFSISFNLALILSFWLVLLVSDRNFGWSSTLNISANSLFAVLHTLSLPWAWLIDSASATQELVAATRFQGLQQDFGAQQIAAMRNWWPYLLCALITYGLLPRVLLAWVFGIRYRYQLRQALLHYPGVNLVLNRLNTPVVVSQSTDINHPITRVPDGEANTTRPPITGSTWLVDWSGALDKQSNFDATAHGLHITNTVSAGLTLPGDEQSLANINRECPDTVVIAVKSWEPPLADLADFISAINSKSQSVVLLLPMPGQTISAAEWKDWQRFARAKLSSPLQLMRADSSATA